MLRFLLLLCLPVVAHAQSAPSAAVLRQPWEAQQEKAAAMRREASTMRDVAAQQRAHDDYACNQAFLYYRCLDKSRDKYLDQVEKARQIEAEAHSLDTQAKRALLDIRNAELRGTPLAPANASAPAIAVEPRVPQPTARPMEAPKPTVQPKPTGTLPAERAAEEAASQARQQAREREAAERAAKAREDAARYDQRMREVEEKKAQRGSGPNAAPPAGDAGLPPPPPPPGSAPAPATPATPALPPPPPPPPAP